MTATETRPTLTEILEAVDTLWYDRRKPGHATRLAALLALIGDDSDLRRAADTQWAGYLND